MKDPDTCHKPILCHQCKIEGMLEEQDEDNIETCDICEKPLGDFGFWICQDCIEKEEHNDG